MRKRNVLLELQRRRRIPALVLALVLALSLAVFVDGFSTVSHAVSAGRVKTPGGAKVRSSASTSANALTSLVQNDTVSIKSQVQGSDGYTWYEVYVDADTLGYIRSDLVEITDGTTPPTSTQTTPSTQQPSDAGNNTPAPSAAQVSLVNPVSATVVNGGSNGVRIRSDASTNSQIITTVQNGLVLTVVGQANGLDTDTKVWYKVNFTSNNSEVSGFIRSDFVELSEELTPYVEPEVEDDPPEETETPDPEPEVYKDYETVYQDGSWYLVETATNQGYVISDMFDQITTKKNAYEESEKKVKSQRIWIVILVILLVLAVGAVAFLVLKVRDMMDSAYFNQVERETLRKRNQQGDRKVMQTVGGDRRSPGQGSRPAGTKSSAPGPRPAGTKPSAPGPRPAGTAQGQRPSGTPQGQQRPAGVSQSQSAENPGQGQRPSGASQGQNGQAKQQPKPSGSQGWKSKNFMAGEEDEFEFEFLNYDGDDEQ